MNTPAYFELQADDPSEAAAFYSAVFGWQIARDGAAPIDYWRIATAGIGGAILKRPAPSPPPASGTNAAVVSIEVADYDATAEAIHRHGGRDALPKFAVPGRCWQGYFIDPAGNTFGVFQVDPAAA